MNQALDCGCIFDSDRNTWVFMCPPCKAEHKELHAMAERDRLKAPEPTKRYLNGKLIDGV